MRQTLRPVNTAWTPYKTSAQALEENTRGGFNPGNPAHYYHAQRLAGHLLKGGWGPSHIVNASRSEVERNMRQAGLSDATIQTMGEDIWKTAASMVRRRSETPDTVAPERTTEEATEFRNVYY